MLMEVFALMVDVPVTGCANYPDIFWHIFAASLDFNDMMDLQPLTLAQVFPRTQAHETEVCVEAFGCPLA